MARHARRVVIVGPGTDETIVLGPVRTTARHAKPYGVAEWYARFSKEAADAFEAVTSAVGAAYNRDDENVRANLLRAAPFYANHKDIKLKLWFLDQMVVIYDRLSGIEQASQLSQILTEARRRLEAGETFDLPDLMVVPG